MTDRPYSVFKGGGVGIQDTKKPSKVRGELPYSRLPMILDRCNKLGAAGTSGEDLAVADVCRQTLAVAE
jgi:hypothetical protein